MHIFLLVVNSVLFLVLEIVALVKSRNVLHPCETKQWSGVRFTEPRCDSWSKFEFYEVKTFAEWTFYWRAWNSHYLWQILVFIWLHWHHVWIPLKFCSCRNELPHEGRMHLKSICQEMLFLSYGQGSGGCLQSQVLSFAVIQNCLDCHPQAKARPPMELFLRELWGNLCTTNSPHCLE